MTTQRGISFAVPVAGLAAAVAVIMSEGPFDPWDLAVGLTLLALLVPAITKGAGSSYSAAAVLALSSLLIVGFLLDLICPAANAVAWPSRPQLNLRSGVAFGSWATVTAIVGRALERRSAA